MKLCFGEEKIYLIKGFKAKNFQGAHLNVRHGIVILSCLSLTY